MIRRVRRPDRHNDLLGDLTDKENGIFETYKDALVFAAALGAARGRREAFDKQAESIDYQIFARYGDQEAIFDALALYDKRNIRILSDESVEERLRAFEEYAYGGLCEIEEANGRVEEPLQHVIQRLIAEAKPSKSSEGGDQEYVKIMEQIGAGYLTVGNGGHSE